MRLTQFGSYVFPLYNKADGLDMGDTAGALVAPVGGRGAYDALGAARAPERFTTISTSYEIVEATAAAVQAGRDAIRALAGTRATLKAVTPSGVERFTTARLAKVKMERRREYVFYQPVELTFELAAPGWSGAAYAGAAWQPTASGQTKVYVNGGNRPVRDVIIAVYTGNTAISNVRFRCGPVDWTWMGTVAASTILTVNCGKKGVLNGSANGYSSFVLNAGHTVADWLVLEPGNNTIMLNYSGNGNSTTLVQLAYSEGWY